MGDRGGYVDEPRCPSCGVAYADHPGMTKLCATNNQLRQEIALNRHTIDCYKAMKEGVGIRIADLEAENRRLREAIQDVIHGDWSPTGLQEVIGELRD